MKFYFVQTVRRWRQKISRKENGMKWSKGYLHSTYWKCWMKNPKQNWGWVISSLHTSPHLVMDEWGFLIIQGFQYCIFRAKRQKCKRDRRIWGGYFNFTSDLKSDFSAINQHETLLSICIMYVGKLMWFRFI